MNILVAEDEKDLNRIIVKHLQAEGYVAESCFRGDDAVYYITEGTYDAVILDVMLPGMDGFAVLKEIRSRQIETPVIFLSVRTQTDDIVTGLDIGADDYLTKPFSFDELLARLRVIMRRQPSTHENIWHCGDLTVCKERMSVSRGGKEIELSAREYAVLEYMIRNKNLVLTRTQIASNAWGFDFDAESNVIDVYIRYLRKKIDDDYDKKLIQTVRGVGYCMKE